MHQIYAGQTISVTELKRRYAHVVAEAEGQPVAVLNNNRPEAYLVPAGYFEWLINRLEDMEDAELIRQRTGEPSVAVTLEELSKW